MKLRSLLFGLLLCASAASAADVITRTDGTTINAAVEEITETTIRYRKASNPKGPIYSIPVATVLKIVYDNGSIDNFNTPAETTSHPAVTSTTPTDEELMRYAETLAPTTPSSNSVSDAELLNSYYLNSTPKQLYSKAKTYRIIGWVGGLVLLGAGIGGMCAINPDSSAYDIVPICGAVAGTAWCICFNLRANQLKRQAREIEFYSSSILEDEILRFGDKSLTAGVSVMGNQMLRTQGYGLSLKFNF